jgi:hypothetical protein
LKLSLLGIYILRFLLCQIRVIVRLSLHAEHPLCGLACGSQRQTLVGHIRCLVLVLLLLVLVLVVVVVVVFSRSSLLGGGLPLKMKLVVSLALLTKTALCNTLARAKGS